MLYRAFISYSHRDKAAAGWIHRALESYHLPARLVGATTAIGPAPQRLTPIFRDRDELSASPDLGSDLRAALEASMFLLVVCSPAAARSHWVDEEILAFKRLHGERRVLALIVGGEPFASAHPERAEQECFPRALRFRLGDDGALSGEPAEPIAADLRPAADGRRLAKLKLVAGLTGLRLDDLVQRETQRRVRRLGLLAAASAMGMVLAGALAIYANARRIDADHQRRLAEKEAATAKASSDLLIGAFALSNPETDNPRTITALTILDRSAARARVQLAGQPVVEARLIATLGQAYNNLGLYDEARQVVEGSLPAVVGAGPDGVAARLALANSYYKQSQLERASRIAGQAEIALGPDQTASPDLRARAAVIEGQIWAAKGDTRRGLAAYDRALVFYRSAPKPEPRRIAAVLQNRGLLLDDDNQYAAAEVSLNEALDINRRVLGDQHLDTGQSWFALAQNALMAGDLPLAATRIANAVAIERRVLDAGNPILADSLELQGRIFQSQKKLPQAEQSLGQSIAIDRKAFGRPHFKIGIEEVYLALVESDMNKTDAALALLDDAKHNYDVGYGHLHANHGDLLVNRARVLAHAGRRAEARVDCASGVAILGQTLGPAANYTRQMAATCARI